MTAVPGGCIPVNPSLALRLAAAKVLVRKLLIPLALHKDAPDARVEALTPGRTILTRRGERNDAVFVLDQTPKINGILSFLSPHARHIKAGGLDLASEIPLFHVHQFSVERARLVISEGDGLKAWPTPDEHLVHEWADANHLKSLDAVQYDDSSVSYRMHIMATLIHLEEGYPWLMDTLRDKPGFKLEYIKYEWDEVKDLNPGPRYYAQMKPVRPEGAASCINEGAVKAPIQIQTDRHIPTEVTGFWNVKTNKRGEEIPTSINYQDLLKKFKTDFSHKALSDVGLVYTYNGTHFELMNQLEIKGWMYDITNPKPKETARREFLNTVQIANRVSSEWLSDSTDGMMNLQNGVFNMDTGAIGPHSTDYGFRYCLPYDHDPAAECPAFEQFLLDITKERMDIVSALQEFMGYAIASGPCYGEKALIMYGGGSNGKSTFMNVLKDLAGKDNYSSLSLTALQSDTKRYQIDGKLFNLGEETNVRALGESEVFKAMVTGGEVDVKKLYVQDYSIQNRTKLIMACNELPKSSDKSHGLYRRMLLIPFDAKFEGEGKDKFIQEKLKKELPGIFNFAMAGYKRLRENKYVFTEGTTIADALESYKLENDNVLSWAHDNVQFTGDSEDYLFKDEMYKSYKDQSIEDGLKPFSKVNFFKSFYEKYSEAKEAKRQSLGLGTGRKRVLLGIRKVEL
jgi:P4 family phage/plasmid primase-like protien